MNVNPFPAPGVGLMKTTGERRAGQQILLLCSPELQRTVNTTGSWLLFILKIRAGAFRAQLTEHLSHEHNRNFGQKTRYDKSLRNRQLSSNSVVIN